MTATLTKLYALLETPTVMLLSSTQAQWNSLTANNRNRVLRTLLSVVERLGRTRLTDMDYQNAMNSL